MKNRLLFASAGLLCLAATSSAQAKLPAPIKACYTKLVAALNKGDYQTFQSFFAPAFVNVNAQGQVVRREQFLGEAGGIVKKIKKGDLKEKILGVKDHGRTVEVEFDLSGTIQSEKSKAQFHEAGTDTWARINGKWLLIKTVDKTFEVKPIKK